MGSGVPSLCFTLCLNGIHVTPGMQRGVAPTCPVTLNSGSAVSNHIQQGGFIRLRPEESKDGIGVMCMLKRVAV